MKVRGLILSALSGAIMLGASAQAATIGSQLQNLLSAANLPTSLEVIVTFNDIDAPGQVELDLLNGLGLSGVTLQSLPMAGVIATPAQIALLDANPSVRSIYYNAPLEYELREATQLSGVDRLRDDQDIRINGLPVSGRGIGVLVNDSGIDGLHADVSYPDHVVQNVLAQTNLQSFESTLPVTYLENQPNTDIGGGHGSHVAGIVGANGANSNGEQEGVAPGADLIGYGSGAALFILDTLGGFDYALTHQFQYNIRVVSNSFGNTGDTGTDFDPEDPTNIATKRLVERGVMVVFSAGNSGSGEGTITGNFKKAPWVITAAAGDKNGLLADFSSRGVNGNGGTVVVDGEEMIWEDRPTVTAPGVDIYSVRASTSDPLPFLDAQEELDHLGPAQYPFYTRKSGTSMSAPHVSGIVALMLEANPNMDWRDVKSILQDTATNMPGREEWEAGAGYVNAYAAVQEVLNMGEFGETVNQNRGFNASANISVAAQDDYSLFFSPIGLSDTVSFTVAEGISLVSATANVSDNAVAIALTDPNGNRYGSSISLPVLGQNIATSAPGVPGTWELTVSGIGAVSGVVLDPAGITNGIGLPGNVDVRLTQLQVDGFTGLNDIAGHPAQGFIEVAVRERLVDSKNNGRFQPNSALRRRDLAEWMMMGAGVRQAPASFQGQFNDSNASRDATTAIGAPLKSLDQDDDGVILAGNSFNPNGLVSREELAYNMVQALGLEDTAMAFQGDIQIDFDGSTYTITDQDDIDNALRGYVAVALATGLIPAQFSLEQGPFNPFPTLTASFDPNATVTRAFYAATAVRFLERFEQSAE